ncbi:TetR/AcrR family transcriptional regulator [Acidiferrobacter sp.]|jgi:AcrR family transcriptional regulator|uniref:TetR/AcrR family transcriptional regulator n=1 Tax=Acidiferrobacter sp. TaxID=1872107 RepID=UPI002616FC6C|nr:TetR/AcrR family transcriptional regulator [Acidiferrobacter sp.]
MSRNVSVVSRTRTDTRERVLTAGLRLFTRHGYFNTTTHDIARESRVSIGAIYHHFRDKEGIARGVYTMLLERMVDIIQDIHRLHSSTHDRCRALMAVLFKLAEEEPEAMEFMLHAKHREFLPTETPVCSSKPFAMMRDFVREGAQRGEIRAIDPMVASVSLFGGAIRMIIARLDGVVERALPEYLDEVWACGWRAVAP